MEDLRSALRAVVRARALTAVLLVSLALGTGANAAVCGIVYRLLFSAPEGMHDPGSLVSIYTSEFSGSPYGRTSYPDFESVSNALQPGPVAAFDDSAFANVRVLQKTPEGETRPSGIVRRVRVTAMTGRFFETLGLQVQIGASTAPNSAPPKLPPAVVSFDLALTLDAPATIIGRTLIAGEREYLVAGVAPQGFRGLRSGRPSDVWIPLEEQGDRGDRRLSVIARHTSSPEQLNGRLTSLTSELAQQFPETNRGALTGPDVPRQIRATAYSPVDPGTRSGTSVIATLIVAAVALLLAGACVNAGTLLLSRAMARRREVAVKMALGAARWALARQLLLECLIICAAGGALGLLFATWIVRAVPAMFSPEHAALLDTDMDGLLLLLTLGVATTAGVAFGIAPAIHGTGASAALALRADSGGVSEQHGGTRARGLLITAQLAVSTLLLVTTTLLITGLSAALEGDYGVQPDRVAMLAMNNPGSDCKTHDPVRGVRYHHAIAEALPKTTGIASAGWAATPPLGNPGVRQYAIQAGARALDRVDFAVNVVTPGYFQTMGIGLMEGRLFDHRDGALSDAVAVVDELLARRHFGPRAVGEHLLTQNGEPIEIIGVVRSGRYRTLQDSPQPTVYLPYSQEHLPCGFLFVRTAGDPAAMMTSIMRTLTRADAGVTITRTTTLDRHLSEALAIDRMTTTLVGICGIIALLMAMAGVYGVMSDAVLRRTREIGLRVALGAQRPQVLQLMFAEATWLTATGVLLGLGLALILERVAAAFVYGLPSLDAKTLAAAPAVLVLVIVLAAILPMRRALAVSPTIALRAE
jgi:predicted permease